LEQAPPEHAVAPVHAVLQPPQWFGSTLVGMHAPLQNDWYAGHVHVPFTHVWPPVHACVQLAPPPLLPLLPLLLPPLPLPLLNPPPLEDVNELSSPPPSRVVEGLFPFVELLPHASVTSVAMEIANQGRIQMRMGNLPRDLMLPLGDHSSTGHSSYNGTRACYLGTECL
jgi:hypothetical protein